MDFLQIEGKEIPLLEAPQRHEDPPRRILYVLFKHKLMICVIFLLLSVPIFLYLLFRPAQYIATAKVLLNPTREFLNLSPTSTSGTSTVNMAPSMEMINTEIQIIKSPELAERLAADIPFPDDPNGKNRSEAEIRRDGPRIRGLLTASHVKLTNLIEISVTSSRKPEWIASVANRAAELYLEQQIKVRKTQGIEAFYDEQEKKLRAELINAEETLKAFQVKEKIIDAPEEVKADLTALASFERNLKETDSLIRETEQKIATLDDQLKQQKATISSSQSITVNPVYQQIRTRLTQLELERDGLLQRYTPDDRLVKDKEAEIGELKKKLETVKETSVGSESISLNDVHRRILNELLQARVHLRALNEKKIALTRQVDSYSTTAADKKRKGFEYDRLLREVNAKKENLDLYKKRAEEARISDAMDERKFSNAYILERASLPLPHAGRSAFILMFITIIGAMGIAVAAAFGLEYLNKTLRNEDDIEEQIGLPVLATIQYYGDLRPVRQIATEENI
jgi:succinoglycan biosynthesis transport protein ExoP